MISYESVVCPVCQNSTALIDGFCQWCGQELEHARIVERQGNLSITKQKVTALKRWNHEL